MKCTAMQIEKRHGIAGRHIVSCGSPAVKPQDALQTGNGVMLVKDRGIPWKDTMVIQREELASPQWFETPKAPLIRDYLPMVRKKILEGKYQEAGELADIAAAQNGTPPSLNEGNQPHPAMELYIRQDVNVADDYLHTVNMRTSLITTRWEDDGEFKREVFCSRADGIMVLRFLAPEGRLNMSIKGGLTPVKYEREKLTTNTMPCEPEGAFECLAVFPKIHVKHHTEGIELTGIYDYCAGSFVSVVNARVQGGTVCADEDGIHIKDANQALFLFKGKRWYKEVPEEAAHKLLQEIKDIQGDFDFLLERHVKIHQPMFDRLTIDLGGEEEDYLLTTVELKEKQFTSDQIVPAYMEAMVDMGRFFLLNECGKFPPIYGHVNVNVNHQVSGGNIGNLPEMMESFFNWIEGQLPDARENAERILGARGFFLACHPDEETGKLIHFNRFWPHHYWISSSGWCLQPFLEHYYCTGDEEFLKTRVIPRYKELALLYEDFLSVKDDKGKRMFIPSYSPENWPQNVLSMLNINATMDIAVCREVFRVLLGLGVEKGMVTKEEQERWEKLVSELPDYLTDQHGELKEWACAEYEERYDHRHASHLYGAFPADEIQPELDEKLYRAAQISNRMRALGNESCHGIMHRAQIAARLKDRHLVEQLVRFTLESGYVTDAFTTVHNPYQTRIFPDGQGALPTVLLESVLYSRPHVLEPLPALIRDSFPRGELRGMASRSFATVDSLRWDLKAGTIDFTFTSLKDQEITLCYRRGFESIWTDQEVNLKCLDDIHSSIQVKEGHPVTVRWNGIR